jgi:hypothetical protein
MINPKVLEQRKRDIENRLEGCKFNFAGTPEFSATNIKYEMAERTKAMADGGIGVIHKLVQEIGLAEAINEKVVLLKLYMPYRESDHVLNIAYNAICGGRVLEDIELRRNDEVFLDALEADRIPDPTTAGDFCRRFDSRYKIGCLMDAIDDSRLKVWAKQSSAFFNQAIIDMDGHLVGTTGQCKEGMDIAYDGTWGYHPLIVSLANTGEVLSIENRPGNRPSHEGAHVHCDRAIGLCRRAGFRSILLRGDTDFSQTAHLDRWNADSVTFHFGYNATPNLQELADNLGEKRWKKLKRPPRYQVQTQPRSRPSNVKEAVVREREFDVLNLVSEEVAEFKYRPTKCKKTYRMIVVRKNISHEKGEARLFDEIRYFFYITNDRDSTPAEIVFSCNDRCHQENLIEQLTNGVPAMRAAVDNLLSNWAYMVMTALAWNLKAWVALWLPEKGRSARQRRDKQRLLCMEFRTFVNHFIKIPCQIIHSGRCIVYRLLSWKPYLPILQRLAHELNC